ncbi:alpha/beta hydrolase [Flavobacteriaceae bacterium]|nr:alpha/beta hydrolase [Flavobacteriaceae bacterium]
MKRILKSILVLFACFSFLEGTAQNLIDTIVTKAAGYDIPIRIKLPKKAPGKSPVYFFVHGGGWNGGDAMHVPPAGLSNDANYLADQLGVIYVGLAYRCKGNNATFSDAIEDLEASVQWFFDNAEKYNADITRIGFGGASAGSTLAAIMAQKYENCKLLVGAEGMYNLIDHSEERSTFPNQKARKAYGLATKEESKKASAYYNLRKKPPITLLLHGDADVLCHYTQSIKFAEKIKFQGGEAKVVLHKEINHTTLNPSIPDVFKESILEIAVLFIDGFNLNKNTTSLEALLDKRLKNQYASSEINESKLVGSWTRLQTKVVFKKNGKGFTENIKTKKRHEFNYSFTNDDIKIDMTNSSKVKTFKLKKNSNFICEHIKEGKRIHRRFLYKKQKS